jgi:hypothetical protein
MREFVTMSLYGQGDLFLLRDIDGGSDPFADFAAGR